MLMYLLGQSGAAIPPQDKALINLLFIVTILAIGLLMLIGLTIAFRNYLRRNRELEQEHEERDNNQPRPDAWATSAQRLGSEDLDPDEAHVSSYEDEYGEPPPDLDEDEEDDDDFPFRDPDEDEDDGGPIGRT